MVDTKVEEVVSETRTLFPTSDTVTIDDTEYRITAFRFGKTLLMLEFVTELLERTDLTVLLRGGAAEEVVTALANELPNIMKYGQPVLYRAIGLTLTPDKEIAQLDVANEDIRKSMYEKGKTLAFTMTLEQASDVVALGIRSMGIETIKDTVVPKLAEALRNKK